MSVPKVTEALSFKQWGWWQPDRGAQLTYTGEQLNGIGGGQRIPTALTDALRFEIQGVALAAKLLTSRFYTISMSGLSVIGANLSLKPSEDLGLDAETRHRPTN